MAPERCHRTYKIMARAALGKFHGRLLLRSRMERPMDSSENDLRRRIVGGLSSVAHGRVGCACGHACSPPGAGQ